MLIFVVSSFLKSFGEIDTHLYFFVHNACMINFLRVFYSKLSWLWITSLFAEKMQSVSDQRRPHLETKITNSQSEHELGLDTDHFHVRHSKILDRSLAIGHNQLTTSTEQSRSLANAAKNGEIPFKSSVANRKAYKEFQNGNESDFKIKKILKEMLSSKNIPSFSDNFRDIDKNTTEISDPNAQEVAKVVAKYMEGYDNGADSVNSISKLIYSYLILMSFLITVWITLCLTYCG